jgi:hypothetical protein
MRIVTSPTASMPSVTGFDENSISSFGTPTMRLMALYTASTGPVPWAASVTMVAVGRAQLHRGRGDGVVAARHLHLLQAVELLRLEHLVRHQRLDVAIRTRSFSCRPAP